MTDNKSTAAVAKPGEEMLWDVTKNPGSGKTGLSAAEKIERNRNIARLWHANHARPVADRRKERVFFYWSRHGCVADDCVMTLCTFDPKGLELTPRPKPIPAQTEPDWLDQVISHEVSRYWISDKLKADDLRSGLESEGGFTIDALWEDGVVWTVVYRVRTADGRFIAFWETYVAQMNEAGQISQMNVWTDDLGFQDLLRTMWDPQIDVQKMTLVDYTKLLFDGVDGEAAPSDDA